ncbi:TPA: hypothetical protein HL384_27180, partial [Escherichia coli]|nr:hypothetical protein [Escherichia coli]
MATVARRCEGVGAGARRSQVAFKENRLPRTSFQSCATAIKAGKCKALKMMVEEIRKGESLYFEDMTALIK